MRRARKRPVAGGVTRARRLRREQTVAEKMLWEQLRLQRMNFRRQAPIGPYVVDFSHPASRLLIEVDGPMHDLPERQARDAARTAFLEAEGFRVIRFPEADVRNRTSEVVKRIVAVTQQQLSGLSPRGKGDKRYDVR